MQILRLILVPAACYICHAWTALFTPAIAHDGDLRVTLQWRHVSNNNGCEIACYVPHTYQLMVTDGDGIAVLDARTGRKAQNIPAPPGFHPTSVAYSRQRIAVAWAAKKYDSTGRIDLYNATNPGKVKFNRLASFAAGYLPDMVVFSPDGHWLLSANEGEPTDDYHFDPPGSITAIELHPEPAGATVHQLNFDTFDSQRAELRTAGVRIIGPSSHHADGQATVSEDLEPEYIAVSADSKRAWVSLQENNAIAELDLSAPCVTAIYPLGLKSFRHSNPQQSMASSYSGTGLDASDVDGGSRIRHWPVFGMYQPDAIGLLNHGGNSYLLTVNEGDPRKYASFDERTRIDSLLANGALDPRRSASFLINGNQLGRLEVTSAEADAAVDVDDDGDLDRLCCFGTRSFSVWSVPRLSSTKSNSTVDGLQQVFDSGNDFEWITAQRIPVRFNADSTPVGKPDERSIKRGPEPEGLAIGRVGSVPLAAIGLERTGGVMLYDVSFPQDPKFIKYIPPLDRAGRLDCAPEGLVMIPASESPTGTALLAVCNEGSHTVTAYELSWQ